MKSIDKVETINSLLFQPTEKAREINLETLKNSVSIQGDYGQMPAARPVQHYEFLEQITDIFGNKIGNVIQEPIFVSKNHSKRIFTDKANMVAAKEECPVKNYLFDRVTTRISTDIQVKDDKDKGYSPAIGISYNERGITVCMGVNVWVCSNMSVFGGKLWSSYGSTKIAYEQMIELFKAQVGSWEKSFEEDMQKINRLKEHTINVQTQQEWTVKMYEKAIRANSQVFKQDRDLVLNQTQLTSLTRELLVKRDTAEVNGNELSAWDYVNAGTENLKADTQDHASMFPTLQTFNNHVLELVAVG
jgi:hypothetical protein